MPKTRSNKLMNGRIVTFFYIFVNTFPVIGFTVIGASNEPSFFCRKNVFHVDFSACSHPVNY